MKKIYTQKLTFHNRLLYVTSGDRFVSNNSAAPRFEISYIGIWNHGVHLSVRKNDRADGVYRPHEFVKELTLFEKLGGTYMHTSSNELSKHIRKLAKSMDRYKAYAHR